MQGLIKLNPNTKIKIKGAVLEYESYDAIKVLILAAIETELPSISTVNKSILASMIQELFEIDILPTPILQLIPFAIKTFDDIWKAHPEVEHAYNLKAYISRDDLLSKFYKQTLTPYEEILERKDTAEVKLITEVYDELLAYENDSLATAYTVVSKIQKLFTKYLDEGTIKG